MKKILLTVFFLLASVASSEARPIDKRFLVVYANSSEGCDGIRLSVGPTHYAMDGTLCRITGSEITKSTGEIYYRFSCTTKLPFEQFEYGTCSIEQAAGHTYLHIGGGGRVVHIQALRATASSGLRL